MIEIKCIRCGDDMREYKSESAKSILTSKLLDDEGLSMSNIENKVDALPEPIATAIYSLWVCECCGDTFDAITEAKKWL